MRCMELRSDMLMLFFPIFPKRRTEYNVKKIALSLYINIFSVHIMHINTNKRHNKVITSF